MEPATPSPRAELSGYSDDKNTSSLNLSEWEAMGPDMTFNSVQSAISGLEELALSSEEENEADDAFMDDEEEEDGEVEEEDDVVHDAIPGGAESDFDEEVDLSVLFGTDENPYWFNDSVEIFLAKVSNKDDIKTISTSESESNSSTREEESGLTQEVNITETIEGKAAPASSKCYDECRFEDSI